jgi:AcrR family transcriptional regulator
MDASRKPDQEDGPRRNRGYLATHQALIEAAVRLIADKGVEALSVAGLARAVEIDRTTVYHHFANREALLEAVSAWSSDQLAQGLSPERSQRERVDFLTQFVLENPDLIKLWIEQFIAPGDIRERYPNWDRLIEGTAESFGSSADAEVYCTLLVTGAIIGPRVFRNSVRPDLDEATIVERFRAEQQRMLKRDGLLKD